MIAMKLIASVVMVGFLSGCASITPAAWSNKNYCTDGAAYSQGKHDAMTLGGKYNRNYSELCFTTANDELNQMYAKGYYDGLPFNPGGAQAAEPMPDLVKESQYRAVANFFYALSVVLSDV